MLCARFINLIYLSSEDVVTDKSLEIITQITWIDAHETILQVASGDTIAPANGI